MLQQIAFIPQRQFHVLISFSANDERVLAILPNEAGRFRVVDQGKIIADIDPGKKSFIYYNGKLADNVITQLESQIKEYHTTLS